MIWMILLAVLLVIVMLLCWVSTLVGLPGNWGAALVVLCYWLLVPADWAVALSWQIVVTMVVLAAAGELIEFAAGALGTAKAGGSKRGAALALLGSMIGGLAGLLVAVPVPVVGQLIAALLLACIGAMVGAVVGELWKGRGAGESLRIGYSAFWGRLMGTLAKLVCGAVMIIVVIVGLLT